MKKPEEINSNDEEQTLKADGARHFKWKGFIDETMQEQQKLKKKEKLEEKVQQAGAANLGTRKA